MSNINTFGKRLKELRSRKRITQLNLSLKIGICQESISSYERGTATPSVDVILKLSEYFRVSTDYLLGISDNEISVDSQKLNSFETYLLANYRHLSPQNQKLLIRILDDLYEFEKQDKI